MDLFGKVRKHLISFFEKNDKILLAISGGPDSILLFHFLYRIKKELNLKIYLAHFNHKLRGRESEKDKNFIEELSKKYNVNLIYGEVDIKRLTLQRNESIEKVARDERYKFLIKEAIRRKIKKIVLGHNKDDNIETILFRFIKGTGLHGILGIPEKRIIKYGDFEIKSNYLKKEKLYLLRPLLNIYKKDILKYLKNKKIKYRIDKTNLKNIYVRNKIRNELIPYIEKYNPNFKTSISNFAYILNLENEFIEKNVEKIYKKIVIKNTKKEKKLKLDELKKLHPAIVLRIIKKILGDLLKHHRKITFNSIKNIYKNLENNKKLILPENIAFNVKKNIVIFKKL